MYSVFVGSDDGDQSSNFGISLVLAIDMGVESIGVPGHPTPPLPHASYARQPPFRLSLILKHGNVLSFTKLPGYERLNDIITNGEYFLPSGYHVFSFTMASSATVVTADCGFFVN